MKNYKNCKGIGLVEVMVTTVVIGLGLLAVAALQGDLMSGSGLSKTRSAAFNLAEQKLEELKNNIDRTDYDAHAAGSGSDTPTAGAGGNASFTRSWTITDNTGPDRKSIDVSVSWGTGADEKVSLNSEFVWADPSKSVSYATDGTGVGGLAPSPNNNSSSTEEEADADTNAGSTLLDSEFGSYQGTDADGNTILLDDDVSNGGTTLLTCFGSKLIGFKGTVYTVNNLNNIAVDISQYGYCFFDPGINQTQTNYACYACGNCVDSSGSNGCPASPLVTNDIGAGGWYGKVGLKGVDDDGGGKEKVCFSEHLLDPDAISSTAREYVTRRTSGTTTTSEGINTSYNCQNFLIVNDNGPNSSCSDMANTLAGSGVVLSLKQMLRTIPDSSLDASHPDHPDNQTTENNQLLADNNEFCSGATSYSISGNITGSNLNKVTISINRGGACESAKVNSSHYTYSCTVTTSDSDVTISASTSRNGYSVTPASYTVGLSNIGASYDFESVAN